jgi:hypothetical protein
VKGIIFWRLTFRVYFRMGQDVRILHLYLCTLVRMLASAGSSCFVHFLVR